MNRLPFQLLSEKQKLLHAISDVAIKKLTLKFHFYRFQKLINPVEIIILLNKNQMKKS